MPAGTAFATQLSAMHTDDETFKNHKEFNPERFMENNNLEKKLIPFGIGKRSCPGESLARAELYLVSLNLNFLSKLNILDHCKHCHGIRNRTSWRYSENEDPNAVLVTETTTII